MNIQTIKSTFTGNLRLLYRSDLTVVTSVNSVVNNFEGLAKSNGLQHAIKVHKEIERHCKMRFLKQPSVLNHKIMWVKMKGDFPRFLKINVKRVDQPEYIKAMLTALAYYRMFTLPVCDDISNITTPGPDISEHTLKQIEEYAADFFKDRGIKAFAPSEDPFPAYATTKAGANGPSAMGSTSLKDILSLEKDGLYQRIISLSTKVYTKSEILVRLMEDSLATAKQTLEEFTSRGLFTTARLHLLAEGGGKTRVICIPDVWTQSVLKPIHQYLMNCLRRMPCDGSFGHDVLGNKVKKFTKHRGLYCFDLTAATDRFPLAIQVAALKPLLGEIVHEWSDLLVNRKFTFKSKNIEYKVGQPMGLLTSWAAFSLTHHVIINWLKDDKSFYAVIGDDVAISSKEGARKYRTFMSDIGVSINDSKSLIPDRSTRVAEIAKRQFSEGIELSPIPPRVLIEATANLEGLLEFLQVLATRTDKFRQLTELERTGVRRLVRKNKEFKTDKFQVLLTCPLQQYNPLGEYKDLLAPLLEGLPERWDTSMPIQTYQNELDSWLLGHAVNTVNRHPLALSALGLGPSPSISASQSSPLVASYLVERRKVLEELFRRAEQRITHEFGEADTHLVDALTVTSADVYQELISGPDPLSPKDFMEKRRIRRKQSVDLLFRYYSQSRFTAKIRRRVIESC